MYRAYIYSGPGIGEEREVSDWTVSNNTMVLAPVFTTNIASNSYYELHYIFTADEYLKAINLAIESMGAKYLIDIMDITSITLSADTYEYELPLTMLYLEKVTTEHEAGGDVFEVEDEIDPRDYTIIRAYPPILKLHEDYYSITAGKDLRLEGQGAQSVVDDDTDVISLPPSWLVQKAITFLPSSKIQSNKLDETYRRALILSSNEPRVWPSPKAQRVIE